MYTELTQACAGKKLEEHPLEVQQISSQQEAMGCKLVFLGEKEQNQLSVLSKAIQNDPIVLICETAGSISQGADINFTIKDDRLRFELNINRLQRKSIQVANELKRLAIISN